MREKSADPSAGKRCMAKGDIHEPERGLGARSVRGAEIQGHVREGARVSGAVRLRAVACGRPDERSFGISASGALVSSLGDTSLLWHQ